jgi:hypothetical protein
MVGTEKKSVHIQNNEVFIIERAKTSKIRLGNPEGVEYKGVSILEKCSLL